MSNQLQLNPVKTEVLWCSSARRRHQIPTGPACVGDTCASGTNSSRPGVYTDADVSMSAHVIAIVKVCFAALPSNTQCALFADTYHLVDTSSHTISGQLLQWLQSVFNAAARLMFSARKSEHITPLLHELHG